MSTLPMQVEQIQESQESRCKKIMDYLKAFSIFQLKIGIFHNSNNSFVPTKSVIFTLLIMFCFLVLAVDILFTLNQSIGERIWELSTHDVQNLNQTTDITVHYPEILIMIGLRNTTFTMPTEEICSKVTAPIRMLNCTLNDKNSILNDDD